MKPVPKEIDYKVQEEHNNRIFEQMFPGLNVPPEIIYELLRFLSETKVNVQILPRVIRGVNNIIIGTGKGQVIVHVSKDVMNVSVRETDDTIQTKT